MTRLAHDYCGCSKIILTKITLISPIWARTSLGSLDRLKRDDGAKLDYQMLKPADIKRGEKRPAIILVYGGPHAQLVHKGWRKAFDQNVS